MGLRGDLLEIGSYCGRSTALMGGYIREGERLFVCDAFEANTDDPYEDKPSPEALMANLIKVNGEAIRNKIVIHNCLSNDLQLEAEQRFRFIHIDGGHSADQVYADLQKCGPRVLSGGIMVMDDYQHPDWPGVTEGTDRFLKESSSFEVLADLNRHGAKGRKLYLIKK